MLLGALLFMVGLALMIIAGDRFVDAAIEVSKKIKIPAAVISATIVSIGTTVPEVLVSANAVAVKAPSVATGVAFGSIICNTALIAGLIQLIRPAQMVVDESFRRRLVYFMIFDLLLLFIGLRFGKFEPWVGLVLLAGFVCYAVNEVKRPQDLEGILEVPAERLIKPIIVLICCTAMLAVGSRLVVVNGVKLAEVMGVSERVIAVTFIALGTSLPELVTAISALMKGKTEMSVGTLVGANLLDLLLVIGIPAIFGGMQLDPLTASVDIPVGLAMMFVLTVPMLIKKRGYHWQGVLLVLGYLAYCLLQF